MADAPTMPTVGLSSRIDPRTLLAAFVSLAAWVSTAQSFWGAFLWMVAMMACFGWLLATGRMSQLSARSFLLWILTACGLTILLYLFFGPRDGVPIISLFGVSLTSASLEVGATMALRLTALILLSAILVTASRPLDLAAGLTRMTLRLRRLWLPSTQVYYLSFFLVRMVPVLLSESHYIRLAQQSRGIRLGSGFLSRLRSSPSILIPTLASALTRADHMTLALTARGFDTSKTPANVMTLRFRVLDLVVIAGLVTGWVIWGLSRLRPV